MSTTKITLDGIDFTIKNNKQGYPVGLYNSNNGDYSDVGDGKDNVEQFINAVDIDWNNAEVEGNILSTSGQVLHELKIIEQILKNI